MVHPCFVLNRSAKDNLLIALKYYHAAIYRFARKKSDVHENIHQVRLCFKRVRSILRLYRFSLAPGQYRQWNIFYRDLSRKLSDVRDLTATIETTMFLLKKKRGTPVEQSLKKLLLAQRKHRQQLYLKENPGIILAQISMELQAHEYEIFGISLKDDSANGLVQGMEKVLKTGQRIHEKCKEEDDEALHQLRKQVKYVWYQLNFLVLHWPRILNAWADEFLELSKLLGKYHDFEVLLHILDTVLIKEREPDKDDVHLKNVKRMCLKEKKKLYNQIVLLNSRLLKQPSYSLLIKVLRFSMIKTH